MATESSESTSSSATVSEFIYTPFYCEENIYFLCKKLCENGRANADGSDLFVVFISNEKKAAGSLRNSFMEFDLLIGGEPRKSWLFIVDPALESEGEYTSRWGCAMGLSCHLHSGELYRVVQAPVFLRGFASDIRHMKDSADGTVNNLKDYMDIHAPTEVAAIERADRDGVEAG
ncbi:unnamed protein product [Linum tenue]|uniref:Protein N-terminal glutamine amidohydrolase n=1 Tax=Linum tenue TaxID=586396 RepID=A0AAV0GXB8_9ROSI|nr:unnamed protein product [Linum tenue]